MNFYLVHVPNFEGCQGRRTGPGVRVTTVSNSLILRGWVTKVLKNCGKNGGGGGGGGRVCDNNMLLFYATGSTKKMPL